MIPFLLTICLIAGQLPQAAFAQSAGTRAGSAAIVLGASQIEGGQQSSVYFGTYPQSKNDDGSYNTDPIKWRVLSTTPNGTKPDDNAWTEGEGLLLLSEMNLDVHAYDSKNEKWNTGELRAWLNSANDGFTGNAFTGKEQEALLTTRLENFETNNAANWTATDTWGSTEDKVFVLSLKEALNSVYGFGTSTGDNDARKASSTDYVNAGGYLSAQGHYGKTHWLLRTGIEGNIVWFADCSKGYISNVFRSSACGIRPAFNLDLHEVLFTSQASVSWPSTVGSLTPIAETANKNEWKMTLKDNNRSGFTVTTPKSVTAQTGGTLEIGYSGAETGANEYISAILMDQSGNLLDYGNIAKPAGQSGTASVTLPSDLKEGETYTLKVFSQQCNGDKMTDYASDFSDITLTIDNTPPTLTAGKAERTNETAATVTFSSSEAGTYYYKIVESGSNAPTIDTSGTGTACIAGNNTISLSNLTGAGAKDIYIAAKDAAGNVSDPLTITIPAAPDTTAPTLTKGTIARTGETTATVKFTSNEAGTYAYLITENGAAAPTASEIKSTGIKGTCKAEENSISISNLENTGAKTIYIAVTDAAGNSSVLTGEIPAYEKTTDPTTDPTDPSDPTSPTGPTGPTNPTSPGLPVHQHSFGAWTVTVPATCTQPGKQERTCAGCGRTETQAISAAGHDWNTDYTIDREPTCTEAGSRSLHCRSCDALQNAETIPALGHSFTNYVSDGNATATKDGTETAKCDRCDALDTRTEAGSALGRQPGTSQEEQAQKAFAKAKPALKLESLSKGKIKASWKAVKGAKGYAIYRADSKNGKYKRIKTITSAKTRSFTDKNRTPGKSYSYKVRAYQKAKNGKTIWSAASKPVTLKAAPAAPKKVKAAAKKGYAALSWKKVKGADKYRVYRSTKKNGKYIKMWETVHLTFRDKNVKPGRTYYYKVAALERNGKTKIRGTASGIVKVKIK